MCMYQTTAASSAIFDLFWECAWVSKDDRWLDAAEILLPFSIQILVSNGRPRVPQALPRVPARAFALNWRLPIFPTVTRS